MSESTMTTARPCHDCGAPPEPGMWGAWCAGCQGRHRREEAYREQEFRRRLVVSQERIGIPRRFRSLTMESADQTPAVRLVRTYYEAGGLKYGRALGLLGPTGVGKTAAAAALANSVLIEPPHFTGQRFMLAASLLRRLLNFDQQAETMEEATTARVLVLDDLPMLDDRSRPLLEEVLIVREANQLPLIFTSNLTPKQLSAAFSDRILDRLRAWGELHQVGGASLRRPGEDS